MTDEEVVERYRRGETLKVIAQAAGYSVAYMASRIAALRTTHDLPYRRAPLPESHPRRKRAALRNELVLKLHAAGVSDKEIADRLRVDQVYVYNTIWRDSPKNYDAELARLSAELETASHPKGDLNDS